MEKNLIFKQKKNYLLLIISVIFSSYSFCADSDLDELITEKTKSLVTQNGNTCTINDEQFDKIFQPLYVKGMPRINRSVGLLINNYEKQDEFGDTEQWTSRGTGFIIGNTGEEITVITAKHVLFKENGIYDNRNIVFSLGCSHISHEKGQNVIADIATYTGNTVFAHDSEDLAYAVLKLQSSIYYNKKIKESEDNNKKNELEKLKQNFLKISEKFIEKL